MQRIMVIQRGTNAQAKIEWIRKQSRDLEIVDVVSLDPVLPQVIDEPADFLPDFSKVDLVLDYSHHPDLTLEMAHKCFDLGIRVVSSGSKVRAPGLFTPPTCCGLAYHESLGAYGRQFGAPNLQILIQNDILTSIEVLRGSPCGSTWIAAGNLKGMRPKEAISRFGLDIQMHCQADPANWDPLHGKSPVHTAGEIHSQALIKTLNRDKE